MIQWQAARFLDFLFCAAAVFAPWYWGCTWPLGVKILSLLMLAAWGLWLLGRWLRHGRLPVSHFFLFLVAALLLLGWGMALNGRSSREPGTGWLVPIRALVPLLPGSVDREASCETMVRITALLGTVMMAAALGRRQNWRRLMMWTLTLTGVSIVLLGCGQRWSRATDIFWANDRKLEFFFATYRNVTNAGEYINLLIPLAAALTLQAGLKGRPGQKTLAVSMLAILVAGALACGSKAAPLVAFLLLLFFAVWHRQGLRILLARTDRRCGMVGGLIVVGVLAAVVYGMGLEITQERWDKMIGAGGDLATLSNRWAVDLVCFHALRDAGLFGFGPGTFSSIFPYYSAQVPVDLRGVWSFAHDDYMQTLLEWGWLGGMLWAGFLGGGMIVGGRAIRANRASWRTETVLSASGILIALGGVVLMAAFDFPFQIASLQFVTAILLGLAWSMPAWERVKSKKPSEKEAPAVIARAKISLRGPTANVRFQKSTVS